MNKCKKQIIVLLAWIVVVGKSAACGSWFEPDYWYYNLLAQEIVEDPQYFPFLNSDNSRFYGHDLRMKNENIQEWEHYLGISYDEAYYLVFKSTESDIHALLKGQSVSDHFLGFAIPAFVKRHKQALLYLAYAKYLEPYMMIKESTGNSWTYYSDSDNGVDSLDYQRVIGVLEKSWKAEKEKELKLRYGYQLVRLAHYNRMYEEAVHYFDKYVEPLNYKPAMYYHALAQKAGAERGMGDVLLANLDFFNVFVNSKDLKEMAITSMLFTENMDFNEFLEYTQTENEKNDVYLLLGYFNYNNPLNEAEKIIVNSPDAVQAKVLAIRAINQIEQDVMSIQVYWEGERISTDRIGEDKKYPLFEPSSKAFYMDVLLFIKRMAESPEVKDTNFWNLTAAYLCFLQKDLQSAGNYLGKVRSSSRLYEQQKQDLAIYIDICKFPQLTPENEVELFSLYKHAENQNFIDDVVANRYYLQNDYAKSFLMNHLISDLENNPNLELINEIGMFYQKDKKNEWEQFIASKGSAGISNIKSFINYLKGVAFLTRGDLNKAYESFQNTSYGERVTSCVFGYNRIECFNCPDSVTMAVDYLDEFDFISSDMNFEELTEILFRLQKIGKGKKAKAAKANYLLGNFYYNVTLTGYFRNLLRFESSNSFHRIRYDWLPKPDIYDDIYFKYYPIYYDNPVAVSQQYLEQAYKQASGKELKIRVAFALSKCEQEAYYDSGSVLPKWDDYGVLVSNRFYFDEMMKYRQTAFFQEVQTHCKYFDYYVNHCVSE